MLPLLAQAGVQRVERVLMLKSADRKLIKNFENPAREKAQSRWLTLARRTKNWRMRLPFNRQMKNMLIKNCSFLFYFSLANEERGVVRGHHTLHSCRPCKIS